MNFIDDFISRGYYAQASNLDDLRELMSSKKIVAYIGFDATATSLHVGSLMQIMILRLLQKHGHKPIVIIGGATSKIGDPTGKDTARPSLTQEDINRNTQGIRQSLEKFLTFGDKPQDALLLDNSQWLDSIGYLNFLRNYGSLISINRMLTMESVKSRLDREQSMSFLEFNYMLLQAYDFYHLAKEYNCVLQIGGSDQWGNILMGMEFTRRILSKEVFALTTPLLTTSSGVKMGKTVGGATWLNQELTSAYDYYQYWRNCEDADVVRFSKLYCDFNKEEQSAFEASVQSDINDAKKTLAYRVTCLCHGLEQATTARETACMVFEKRGLDFNLPVTQVTLSQIGKIDVCDALLQLNAVDSKSDAKRLIKSGAVRLNDETLYNQEVLSENLFVHLNPEDGLKYLKITLGKKKNFLVKLCLK
ncbi:Tyrosine--tRNA ligase [Rickettsiales endosymbiont of Paramecium tredecaurelia]|uniref:tyrosine--tRNA ligase n=1 Tax=Candidatus Sarmatiella mevalonica TaxID=2770581 RepID=UPI001923C55A|nr:tyrosine--tRNA ligase [Candidatus Sarmatiella mevalonica]MBL3284235.1 Tyrosine--tRNA ligase [Candidatus Sarmatiella mevalonica]